MPCSVTVFAALPHAWCSCMQVFQTRTEICVFHGYLSNLDDLLDTLTKSGRSKCTLGNPAGLHLLLGSLHDAMLPAFSYYPLYLAAVLSAVCTTCPTRQGHLAR